MKTRRLLTAFVGVSLAFAALSLTGGCSTPGNPASGILGKLFGRKAAAVEKNDAKIATTEDSIVTDAQFEVAKTKFALAVAPASQPVEVATRTNNNAFSLLNQRSPLTLGQMQEAEETVKGLLSAEVVKREAAEAKQRASEKGYAEVSKDLAVLKVKAVSLAAAAKQEAETNMRLANDLRWTKIVAGSAIALNVGLGLLAFAYKANIGRLQEGAADVFKFLHDKDAGTADAARQVMGVALNVGEQGPLYQRYAKLVTK